MKRVGKLILVLTMALVLAGCGPNSGYGSLDSGPVEGTLEIHYIDVGQADSALLLCGDESMLIDGGNVADSDLVVSYLAQHGVEKLDYVVCTHAHEDHVGGLAGALSQYSVKKVLAPVTEYESRAFENFLKYTQEQGLGITLPEPGDAWTVGTAAVTVLGPVQDYEETNNTSIVLRVDFGETSFLFTGDLERAAEEDLLASGAWLEADVLKVGHHGSDTSTSYPFLREVDPDYAVISVGENNDYGHPSEDTLSRLRDDDVTVYRTDLQGDVVCTSDGTNLVFNVERNEGVQTNPTENDHQPGTYIGNLNSHVFHRTECSGLPAEQNRVTFSNREEALEAGYTPCGRCDP